MAYGWNFLVLSSALRGSLSGSLHNNFQVVLETELLMNTKLSILGQWYYVSVHFLKPVFELVWFETEKYCFWFYYQKPLLYLEQYLVGRERIQVKSNRFQDFEETANFSPSFSLFIIKFLMRNLISVNMTVIL